ncbi:carbohydrate ABC transporter permease [Dyella sp. A6]|uniref:carbohydrate ABC transporter permease n=1 Tax=Dyella aluminiiresistens TaxID=3069105 RepID=UPI002E77945B|nr:carbohydrate ABC transporter permease [Dyella sp. A6]
MNPRLARALVNGLLLGAAAVALFPLLWMLAVSFMPAGTSNALPPPLWPSHPTLDNYRRLFGQAGMGSYLANSLLIAGTITLLSLVFNLLAGYAFAKLRFAGRERLFRVLLGLLVVPAQVAMLPLFLMFKYTGLVDSYVGVVLPGMASVLGIFLVRQYARGLPDELLEAARIDGASELYIFMRIVLPLLRPVVATLAILTFLTAWNDFMWPLIELTDQGHYTLPLGLASMAREHTEGTEQMMAGSVLTVLPVLALFLAMQRQYLDGLLLGSVKG